MLAIVTNRKLLNLTVHIQPTYSIFRLAHALASSFNFQGHVKKTFYVLTDDKVGSGPRLRPQSLAKEPGKDAEPATNMETSTPEDGSESSSAQPRATAPTQGTSSHAGLTLSAKLAAKRKATESVDSPSKARR